MSLVILIVFIITTLVISIKSKWVFIPFGTIILVVGITAGCSVPEETVQKEKQKPVEQALPQKLPDNNQATKNETTQVETPVQGQTAKVISVTDGDTIKVQLANGLTEKVRLILVDTPETKHPRLGVQPFGKEASNFTSKELTGKDVTLELDVGQRDQYGRLLAYVWFGNTLFNERLLEEGLARVAVFPPNTKYVDRFREVQKKAQASGIGIWSIENYAQEDGYHSEGTVETPPASNSNSNSNSNSGGSYTNDPSDDQETNLSCAGKIKGNANSKIYHVPGGSYYESTQDNIVWFCTEAEAQAAGYRKSKR
nr:thermonuclease family protein [Bacillus sp. 1NLA3E]